MEPASPGPPVATHHVHRITSRRSSSISASYVAWRLLQGSEGNRYWSHLVAFGLDSRHDHISPAGCGLWSPRLMSVNSVKMCQGSLRWIPSKTQRHSMFKTVSFILQETWSIIFPLAPFSCIWCRVPCSNFRLSASQRGRSCTGRSTKRPEGVAATWSDSRQAGNLYSTGTTISKWRSFWVSKSSALEFLFRSFER